MKVSRLGILFLARREALVLVAYQDGKHKSIGFGHNDPKLKEGDTITPKEAFDLLKEDVAKREPVVNKALKRDIQQHEFDALFSLYYQGGRDGLEAVSKLINEGKLYPVKVQGMSTPPNAADEFLEWDENAAGVPMKGLAKRRTMEREIFLNADYGELTPIPMWRGNPRTTRQEEYVLQDGDL